MEEEVKHVKVKFLRTVGEHMAGDVAEIHPDKAEFALKERHHWDGEKMVPAAPYAILHSESEKLETHEVTAQDLKNMTAADMARIGKKNIVVTPVDHDFEAKLKRIRKMDEEAGPKGSDEDDDFGSDDPGSEGSDEEPTKEKKSKKKKA